MIFPLHKVHLALATAGREDGWMCGVVALLPCANNSGGKGRRNHFRKRCSLRGRGKGERLSSSSSSSSLRRETSQGFDNHFAGFLVTSSRFCSVFVEYHTLVARKLFSFPSLRSRVSKQKALSLTTPLARIKPFPLPPFLLLFFPP